MFGQYGKGGKERFCKCGEAAHSMETWSAPFAGDMVLMADSAKGLESNLKVMNQLLSR